MKIFKTLIEGQNFLVKVEGAVQRLGFFTTRAVHGLNPTQAEVVIRQELKDELCSKVLNSQDDPPKIVFGEFIEIDAETASLIPKSGCTWYPQDPSHVN